MSARELENGDTGVVSLWERLGFRDNLYATPPLHADAEGARLLIGRDGEVEQLQEHWASFDEHASVEGANGVGKTSLVAVAAYRDMVQRISDKRPLILPISEKFQLTSDPSDFDANKVYLTLARALLRHEHRLLKSGYSIPDLGGLRHWMDSPLNKSRGLSASVMGAGGGGTYGKAANTSAGFTENGLADLVTSTLEQTFPSRSAGGFVAILDNLELLETSMDARRRLEEMRDTVLSVPGVHWVLCGANGIIRSALASTRLTGMIAEPLGLDPLRDEDVPTVIQRRIEEYRSRSDAEAPVDPASFSHLYAVLHKNLRIALKHAGEFARYYVKNAIGSSAEQRGELLRIWLSELADRYAEDAGALTPQTWELFDNLIAYDGTTKASEYGKFGYQNQQAMRPYVKRLEEANLVKSTIDETDSRRRTIEVTPVGWLVQFKRANYRDPAT